MGRHDAMHNPTGSVLQNDENVEDSKRSRYHHTEITNRAAAPI
ncbi:hypothetical protein ACFLQ0_05090 [Nitrospinota bacterium]